MYDAFLQHLTRLEKEIRRLKKEHQQLQAQIAQISPTHIEKIEYHFRELRVETLSGILNIGVTLNGEGDEEISEWIKKSFEKGNIQFQFHEKEAPSVKEKEDKKDPNISSN